MKVLEKRIPVVSLVCWMLASTTGSAMAQEGTCTIRNQNAALLQQGEHYVNEHGTASRSDLWDFDGYGPRNIPRHYSGPGQLFANKPQVVSDAKREPDFLTDAILSAADVLKAEKQAQALKSRGQISLARTMQTRIDEASNRLYGRAISPKEASCISVAERMHDVSWKLEQSEGRQLTRGETLKCPLAEKSYRGIVQLYQHELGDHPLTANAIGDLARVCDREGKSAEAKKLYEQSMRIYQAHKDYADQDMASVLEYYGDFLDRNRDEAEARHVYDLAAATRRKIYTVAQRPRAYKYKQVSSTTGSPLPQ